MGVMHLPLNSDNPCWALDKHATYPAKGGVPFMPDEPERGPILVGAEGDSARLPVLVLLQIPGGSDPFTDPGGSPRFYRVCPYPRCRQ